MVILYQWIASWVCKILQLLIKLCTVLIFYFSFVLAQCIKMLIRFHHAIISLHYCKIDWLTDWLIDWLVEWVSDRVIAWLADLFIQWFIGRSMNFLIMCEQATSGVTNQLTKCCITQPVYLQHIHLDELHFRSFFLISLLHLINHNIWNIYIN